MGAVRPPAAGTNAPGTFSSPITANRPLSAAVIEITLVKPPDFDFRAGQRLRLEHAGMQRDYSMVSAPAERELRLCIRRVAGGRLSPHLAQAAAGTCLTFTGPHGYFTFKASPRPPVFVATGTGIAPFGAMAAAGLSGFILLHGVAQAEDLYYRELVQPRAALYVPCISGTRPASVAHHAGRVTGYIESHLPRRACDFYLCGRQEMIRDVTLLVDEQFPGSLVYSEIFY